MQIVLAQPRGFCAGVERAIQIVERALSKFGPPIYVRHEIVHNRHVVEDRLREIGQELGTPSYLVDDAGVLQPAWFGDVSVVGLTAGASAPEMLVQGVLDGIRRLAALDVSTLPGVAEDVKFRFPAEVS